MKKWIFALLLFLILVTAGANAAYADIWRADDNGGPSTNYLTFRCSITPGEINSIYDFYISLSDSGSIQIDGLYSVDSNGTESRWAGASYFESDGNDYYVNGVIVDNNADISYFKLYFYHSFDNYSVKYNVNAAMSYTVDPTPTPEVTPDVTPEVTPDVEEPEPEDPSLEVTPDPTPTNTPTPTPTPTNTPTPTPTPGPVLELNAFADNTTAVAQYYTGGCESVRSTIEFYEVDAAADVLTKVNSENFVSGAGTMRNTMTPGKIYRYKLTYVFDRDGIQFEKYLWSDDLSCVDQELEDFRNNGKITNFRTLMLYTWENVLTLELPIEGFHISFQTLFIWLMLAVALIWFLKKYIR